VEYFPEVPETDVVALVMSHIPEEMRGTFLIRSRMGFRPMEARRLNVAALRIRNGDDLLDAYNAEARWMEGSERRVLVKAYGDAGVMHIKPNEMGRHFFGTHAVNDLEADIYPVQSWLGHTDPKTTERYAQMRPIPIARILDPKTKDASNEKTAP